MDLLKSALVSTALGSALMTAAPLNAYYTYRDLQTDTINMSVNNQDLQDFKTISKTFEEIIETVENRSIA